MYSGFICGFINTATSPIVMVYGRDPQFEYGIGMGLMHGVVGITNLGLAIWNANMWHKARMAAPARCHSSATCSRSVTGPDGWP
jgi:hypothetical protein